MRRSLLTATLRLALAGVCAAPSAFVVAAEISPNYRNAPLEQVVEAVSQVTGRNFIVDPRVKAQVTMLSAEPMSADAFYEAFLAILQVHGFVAVPAGNVVKIVPDANVRQLAANDLPERISPTSDEIVTQVVTLKNVSAAQMVPILRPLIPQYGHLAAYPASNALVVSDRASNVSRLLRILDRIDRSSDEEVELVRLENATAADVVRIGNALNQGAAGSEGGGAPVRLVTDDRTNSVLVGGEKSQRLRLRALIAHLDAPLDTGGATRIRYLKYADAEDIATRIKQQYQAAPAGGGGAAAAAGAPSANAAPVIWADPATNALVVTAPTKAMREVMAVVDGLDVRRAQVLVEAIIVEVSMSKSAALGVNWALYGNDGTVPLGVFESAVGGASLGSLIADYVQNDTLTSVPGGTTFGVGRSSESGTRFAVTLRALFGDADTNIVSTPAVLTLDNQEAEIKVAQEVPFVTGQYTSGSPSTGQGTVNPFQTVERREVGTILKITPQITDDGTVLMKLQQEVSSLAESAVETVDVVTNKRVINTSILVHDRQIVVVGGLTSDSVREGNQRVPLLGSIPLLGTLFRTRSAAKEKTNLLVFLQPTILLDDLAMSDATAGRYDAIRERQRARAARGVSMMPGQTAPVLPERPALPSRGVPTPTDSPVQPEPAAASASPVQPAPLATATATERAP